VHACPLRLCRGGRRDAVPRPCGKCRCSRGSMIGAVRAGSSSASTEPGQDHPVPDPTTWRGFSSARRRQANERSRPPPSHTQSGAAPPRPTLAGACRPSWPPVSPSARRRAVGAPRPVPPPHPLGRRRRQVRVARLGARVGAHRGDLPPVPCICRFVRAVADDHPRVLSVSRGDKGRADVRRDDRRQAVGDDSLAARRRMDAVVAGQDASPRGPRRRLRPRRALPDAEATPFQAGPPEPHGVRGPGHANPPRCPRNLQQAVRSVRPA